MNIFFNGFFAGLIATIPMSLVMLILFAALPQKEQYPLPPKEITNDIAIKLGIVKYFDNTSLSWITLLSHFGYGASMGLIFSGLIFFGLHNAPINGIFFGLAVWFLSYMIGLPALRILTPATNHPTRRTMMMLSAHVVWGATLSYAMLIFE